MTAERLAPLIQQALDDLKQTDSPAAVRHIAERLAQEAYQLGRHEALIELRTTEQICAELGITRARVQQLARARYLGWKITDRVRVFTAADVDAMRVRTPGRPSKPS